MIILSRQGFFTGDRAGLQVTIVTVMMIKQPLLLINAALGLKTIILP